MHSKDYHSNFKIPIHIHKGQNYLRYLSLLLLSSISGLSVILMTHFGLAFLPIFLTGIFGICCVRFPKLILYDDSFVIEKKGLIYHFNDYDLFKYVDVKSVEFSKGFTDWIYIVVIAILSSGGPGGNSKADQLIIITKEDKTFVFNRFGGRNGFVSTIEMINEKVKRL